MMRRRAIGITIVLFSLFALFDRTFVSAPDVSSEQFCGWNAKLASTEAPRIAAQMPKFAILDADGKVVSGAGQFAELWKFGIIANGGVHIPTLKQESGDCVSMGATNAVSYRQAFQIANDRKPDDFKIPFPPYFYGVSRVFIGKRELGRQAGSVGAWAAQGSISYGVLPVDQASILGFKYSGALADDWGWNGPPKSAVDYAKKFRILTVSQVNSWEDVRDSLVHGYPVTVASNVGFKGGFPVRDGKRWGTRSGNWGHQMCFIGAEDRPGRQKGAYCLNSWGADAHPAPLNGEPPGGFWVDWQTVQAMVFQRDSWAYSDFDGFPADLMANWNQFKRRVKPTDIPKQELVAVADAPLPQKPYILEVRQMFSPYVWLALCVFGAVLTLTTYKFTRSFKWASTTASLLIMLGIGTLADASPRSEYRRASRYNMFVPTVNTLQNVSAPPSKPKPQVEFLPTPTETKSVDPFDEPQIQLASNDPLPVSVWNAFAARKSQEQGPQAWNMMSSEAKVDASLRTYADCCKHEKNFLLVVGPRPGVAHKLQKTTEEPVAYEKSLIGLTAGSYKVFEVKSKRYVTELKPK